MASRLTERSTLRLVVLPVLLALLGAGCRCDRQATSGATGAADAMPRGGPGAVGAARGGADDVEDAAALPPLGASDDAPRPLAAGFWRGVALGLFGEDPDWSYDGLLKEIGDLGATHVELVVPYYQADVEATEIRAHPRFSPPPRTVVRTLRQAHARGLKVLLFPIVRLEDPGPKGDWRGTLRPRDPDAWFASYGRWLLELAALAQRERVAVLSVGSELSTLDTDPTRWGHLVSRVRKVYHGTLLYSGNWDHYRDVKLWDLVDYAGVCGYFALGREGGPSDVASLTRSWRDRRRELESWQQGVGKPLVFTEVGYLSQRGAHAWPWNEGARKPVDLANQRRCFEAFAHTWNDSTVLAGVFFWNWYGWGGPRSSGYTLRGKPAVQVIQRYFGMTPERPGVPPASHTQRGR